MVSNVTAGLAAPTYEDVVRAAQRLAGVAHRTPVLTSRTVNEALAADVYFKCENLQRAGAFKFRGAYNAIAALPADRRGRGVVAYSSGNHAQAVALAARLLATPAVIVMPRDAPAMKVAATRGYGAEIVLYDRYTEDREAIGRQLAQERGLALIPPFDHPDVIAGQGTAAAELLADTGALDVLVTPVGGGGLLSGSALAAQALAPQCVLYGVEPDGADDARQSLQRGEIVTIAPPRSIADGAVTTHIGTLCFPILRRHVRDIVTASDDQLRQTMRLLAERMKLVVEPTGCLPLAALMNGALDVRGQRVGIILSGGNADLGLLAN